MEEADVFSQNLLRRSFEKWALHSFIYYYSCETRHVDKRNSQTENVNERTDFVKSHTEFMLISLRILCRSRRKFETKRHFLWSINRPTHHNAPLQNRKPHGFTANVNPWMARSLCVCYYILVFIWNGPPRLVDAFNVLNRIRSILMGSEKFGAIRTHYLVAWHCHSHGLLWMLWRILMGLVHIAGCTSRITRGTGQVNGFYFLFLSLTFRCTSAGEFQRQKYR